MNDTQVLVKREGTNPTSKDKLYYILTADGLFINRNNEYFSSSVLAKVGPGELEQHKPSLKLKIPKLSVDKLAQVIGFFDWAADPLGEVAVLLIHNTLTNEVELLVPDQVCSQGSVDYKVPTNLAPHLRLIGDIHSHVHFSAFASFTDTSDEEHRPGLHLVIGKVDEEPPQFHCEFVVDGFRFKIEDLEMVIDGDYMGRTKHPEEWRSKCTKKVWPLSPSYDKWRPGYGGGYYSRKERGKKRKKL
jgi:PRTRC genetic system protein A